MIDSLPSTGSNQHHNKINVNPDISGAHSHHSRHSHEPSHHQLMHQQQHALRELINNIRSGKKHVDPTTLKKMRDLLGSKAESVGPRQNLVEAAHTLAAEGDLVLSGGISVLYLFMNLLADLARNKYTEMQEKAKVSRDSQDMANTVNEQMAEVSKGAHPDTNTVALDPNVIKYMEDNNIKVAGKTIDEYLGITRDTQYPSPIKFKGTCDDPEVSDVQFGRAVDGSYQITGTRPDKDGKPVHFSSDEIDAKDVSEHNGKVTIYLKTKTKDKNGNIVDKHTTFTADLPKKLVYGPTKITTDNSKQKKIDKGQLDAVKSSLENESNRASDFVSQAQLQIQKLLQSDNVTVSLINSMQTMLEEMNKSIAQNIR